MAHYNNSHSRIDVNEVDTVSNNKKEFQELNSRLNLYANTVSYLLLPRL